MITIGYRNFRSSCWRLRKDQTDEQAAFALFEALGWALERSVSVALPANACLAPRCSTHFGRSAGTGEYK